MPTGYTADVCDGKLTDFKAFALRCAHAFGALVTLREEPMDSPIPEFKPEPYYVEGLKKAEAELARVTAMSFDECDGEAAADYRKALEAHQAHVAKCKEVRDRLVAMRSKVADWQPPTSEHQGLKDFMIEQLDMTIRQDGEPGTYYAEKALRMSGPSWRSERLQKIGRDIAYYTEEIRKEEQRVATRNKWVSDLRKSL